MLWKWPAVLIVLPMVCAPLTGCGTTPVQPQATTQMSKGEPVALADVPPAVLDAVQKEMPGAVLTKARKKSDGNYYFTDVKFGKTEYNLTVSPDGKILSKSEDDD